MARNSLIFFALSLPILLLDVTFAADGESDESIEPPLEIFAEVDGKVYETKLNDEITLTGAFNNPKLKLRAAETRAFHYGGITFDYPAYYTWESDVRGKQYRSWTLSGNDFKIMYFRTKNPLTPQTFSTDMLKKFEGKAEGATERTLGGTSLKGLKFSVYPGGHHIRNEAFEVANLGSSAVLLFQDNPAEGGGLSAEAQKAIALLEKSFKVAN